MTNKTEHMLARVSHRRIDDTRVLIVVDKYVSGETLKNILDDWQYAIIGICTSSQEAITRVKKDKPDLILTDMELNNCDGIYLARQMNLQTENSNILNHVVPLTERLTLLHALIPCTNPLILSFPL